MQILQTDPLSPFKQPPLSPAAFVLHPFDLQNDFLLILST